MGASAAIKSATSLDTELVGRVFPPASSAHGGTLQLRGRSQPVVLGWNLANSECRRSIRIVDPLDAKEKLWNGGHPL